MPKPRLYLNEDREGNKQFVKIDYDKDGSVVVDYTLIQTALVQRKSMRMPVASKNIRMVYDPANLNDGIEIYHNVEINKRAVNSYHKMVEPDFFKALGQNISDRVSVLKVGSDSIMNKGDEAFTLEDTVHMMQNIPEALLKKEYAQEFKKANFEGVSDYLLKKAGYKKPVKDNVIRLPKKGSVAYEGSFAANY